MARAGKYWITKSLLSEIESISKEYDLKRSDAMRKAADYCRIGREIDSIKRGFAMQFYKKKNRRGRR